MTVSTAIWGRLLVFQFFDLSIHYSLHACMANLPICHLIWLVDPAFVAPTWHTPGAGTLLSLHFGRNHIDPILQFYVGLNISVDCYGLFVTDLRQKLVRKISSYKNWWCVLRKCTVNFPSVSTHSRISIKLCDPFLRDSLPSQSN